MRTRILPLLLAAAWTQTIFYQQDFNAGVPTDWSLNTSDLGSTTTDLYNRWVVSADYNGNDQDNRIMQVGVDPFFCQNPFVCSSEDIPPIPNQPADITGNPQSPFLHVSYDPEYAGCPPSLTAFNYVRAIDPDITSCLPPVNLFARMNQGAPIPAGATNVRLSFFWLCKGGSKGWGEVYYSTDGTNWTQLTSRNGSQQLRNQSGSWYADTISLPGVAGQTVFIGFRFVNRIGGQQGDHGDPPLGVDELRIFEEVPAAPTITITGIAPGPTVCAGSGASVEFSTTGNFGAGNTFTAQLSDANGSFDSPIVLGSDISSPIRAIIPTNLNSGTYQVRIVSSNPVMMSNTQSLTIINIQNLQCSATPNPGRAGQQVEVQVSGVGLPSGSLTVTFNPQDGSSPQTRSVSSLPVSFTHTYADPGTYNATFTVLEPVSQCAGSCMVPITIDITNSLSRAALKDIRLYPNPSVGGAFVEGVPVGREVRVLNVVGQVLCRQVSEGRPLMLPAPGAGLYLVEVEGLGSMRWVVVE